MAPEKRLIDANVLWKALDKAHLFDDGNPRHIAQQTVEEQPTVDAVILPCKIGETVYMIRECSCYGYDCLNDSNSRRTCSGKVYLGKKSRKCHCGYVSEAKFGLKHIADFGKTIFLTREEAKAALAKMDKKENP